MEDHGRARGKGRYAGKGHEESDRKPRSPNGSSDPDDSSNYRSSENGNGNGNGHTGQSSQVEKMRRSEYEGSSEHRHDKPRLSPNDESSGSSDRSDKRKSPKDVEMPSTSAGQSSSRSHHHKEKSDRTLPFEEYQSDIRGVKRPRLDESPGSAASSVVGGRGGAAREEKPGGRRNRERYDIITTRPENIVSKKGTSGQQVMLQANYFTLLKKPTWCLYQYRVDYTPEVEIPGLRKRLMYEQKPMLGGYLFDGKNSLYLTQQLREELLEVTTKDREGNPIKIIFKFVAIVAMTTKESLQVLNLIMRRAMEGLKLQLVGRNFFDAVAKIELRQYNIQLWPGYQTSIRQHEKDILLCVEITNKVMRTETIYDIMHKILREGGNFKEAFTNQVLGMTVLTDYTNKTYRVDDIDFDTTPSSTFDTKDGKISFIDYYKKKYNIRIRDPKQPMLMSKAKEKDLRGGKSQIVALVPELCRATGLSEPMRTNFQLMRAMADYTRMDPRNRIAKLLEYNQRLARTPESMEVLREWNFKLDPQLVEIPGRILKNENVVFGNGKKESSGVKVDWTQQFRNNSMYASIPLKRWYIIFPNRSSREAHTFVQLIQDAARGMRFEVDRPQIITLHDDRNHSYINAIEGCANRDPQLLMLVVPNNNADRYANIKKKCCVERAIPTQVMCHRTITPKGGNPKSLLSVATKVAIQMNCKLGGSPWMIEMPLSGLMTIGYDISRDTKDKGKTYGALVATMDLKSSVQFFSTVSAHSSGEELSNELSMSVTKALKEYRLVHGTLPLRICIYRDGVGEGQTKYVFEHEVQQLRAKLDAIYKSANAPGYRLCFMIVSKRINTRIFNKKDNPTPGTVVDDVITLPERFDFFLVSQSVRQGTVSPTSYNILYDNMGLQPDKLQQLTYKQTHLYYNWSGTTRVPAVCQYAHKLASLVGQYIHQAPTNLLERQLYFL